MLTYSLYGLALGSVLYIMYLLLKYANKCEKQKVELQELIQKEEEQISHTGN